MGSQVDPALLRHRKLLNLTAENITENTIAVNSKTPDLRLKYLFERLVIHLHDFVRETREFLRRLLCFPVKPPHMR